MPQYCSSVGRSKHVATPKTKNVRFASITRSRLDEAYAACPISSCLSRATNAYHHRLPMRLHPTIDMSFPPSTTHHTSPPRLGQSCSTMTTRTLCKLAATKLVPWFPKPRQPPQSGSHLRSPRPKLQAIGGLGNGSVSCSPLDLSVQCVLLFGTTRTDLKRTGNSHTSPSTVL